MLGMKDFGELAGSPESSKIHRVIDFEVKGPKVFYPETRRGKDTFEISKSLERYGCRLFGVSKMASNQ